jgi:TolB-like protein/Tfp pilus assembly protein PilF
VIGTTLSHYRILESLGAGGMGTVYRAHDERLGRDVALKVLPTGCDLDSEACERLRLEARTLSRVNHPGIAAVYDLDSSRDGVEFLVMELVPGVTLDERLRQGPLPEREALGIAVQAAEALAAAHREGVVHRDIKPGNVRVTPEGRLKILDFGVALLAEPLRERAETVTQSGAGEMAGTLAYMAPEQVLGEAVDARTDLYGLGVLLYELLTGRPPFRAELPGPLIDAILHAPPVPPGEERPGLSAGFAAVVLRLLEKRPERRYRTAGELLEDLRALATAGGVAPGAPLVGRRPLRSVAVLPLENLSRDPEQEYFADGMTDALISGLAKVRGLRVISRTSVMRYKTERPALAAVARALHVDAIVEGSVLGAGNRVRITANLIDPAGDVHLWSETYDRDLGDILALQSDVAGAIAREVQCRLTAPEEARPSAVRSVDPGAVQAYLKGRFQWEKRTDEGVTKAVELFQQAIGIDPLYALAYAGLADAHVVLANFSLRPSRESAARARAAAKRALEIDPTLAEAYVPLAAIADCHEWQRVEAERLFRRAIELGPNYANAHHWYSDLLISLGRYEEALAEVRLAQDLDPLSMIISTSEGAIHYYAREYERSVESLLRVIDLDPRFAPTWRGLGGSYEMLGLYDEAIAAFEKSRELTGGSTYSVMALAHTYARMGDRARALSIVEELRRDAPRRYVSPYSMAAVHAALGEKDAAFECLDRSLEERDRALVWLAVSPRFDPLRGDPRIQKFLKAVGAGA